MVTWNSVYLESTYHVLGWMAFFSWTIGFYPQIILNFLRKSVVGLNFDFVVLNLTKHSSYLIHNAALFFSPEIQRQYHEKYGYGERGHQKVSKICIIVSSAAWAIVLVCLIISLPQHSWLWLISVFNTIQVAVTAIKYIPQAFMNFSRKSTVGWSIGFVLLDLSGGLLNFAQMATQSIDQGTMINFYGNVGKTLLSLVVVFFDLVFIIQHFVLYPKVKKETNQILFEEAVTLLIDSPEKSQENA